MKKSDGNLPTSKRNESRPHAATLKGSSKPNQARINGATQQAQREAEKQVREAKMRTARMEHADLAAQHEAAALCLSRELGRLLRCLDAASGDLAHRLDSQAARSGPLPERIRQAKQRLGAKVQWSEQMRRELQQFRKNLKPNDKQPRLFGSSNDAAFADYQWLQTTGLKPD